MLGDWCNRDGRENVRLYDATRTSDFQLSSFLLFSRCHPDAGERAAWTSIVDATINAAISGAAPHTGLLPDFLERHGDRWVPARGKLLEDAKTDGQVRSAHRRR